MFIAFTKQNDRFVENSEYKGRTFTWNDIPADAAISALALTHPVPLIINNKRISPKVSINKFHYYYFFNEAIVTFARAGEGNAIQEPNLQAKIMAGVDVERGFVLEIRLDKCGNVSCSTFPLSALIKKFEKGLMREDILRKGIDCPSGKNLI